MSTQVDRIFEGLSRNSMTLEDACRVLYSESQASPESMRACCERIEIELSQGRITSDAAQLLLDALGERSQEEQDPAAGDEMWVDVPLEPLAGEAARAPAAASSRTGGDTVTEVDLTMDDLLAALDRRGAPAVKPAVDAHVAAELAAPVEWMEWEPEAPPAPTVSSAAEPAADAAADADVMLEAELDLPLAPVVEATAAQVDPAVALEQAVAAPVAPAAELGLEAAGVADAQRHSEVEAVPSVLQSEPGHQGELAQVDDLIPVPVEHTGTVASDAAPAAAAEIVSQASAAAAQESPATATGSQLATEASASAPETVSVAANAADAAIDEVFAPRVEHVLRESSPMAAGALLKDRYRIVGPLAPGGLGQLFEAIDMQVAGSPRVALKLIEVDWQEEPRAFETLQAIVRHVRRLRHPNILSILDIDRDDKHAIIAMEGLRGCWLSSLVREVRGRGVGYAVAWNIISGIANGLAYAHQHGAVHSELNPHMVFLTETGQVKIAGFGLAHAMPMSTEPLAELDGQTLRSYADVYCATHWILGAPPQGVDDLYPLGVIAYELLTGAHPFNRASPAVACDQQLQPLPIPGLDRRIRRVIERCLAFDREDRPATGASFLAHIEPTEKLLDLVRERFT